jgi:hypothetical protein
MLEANKDSIPLGAPAYVEVSVRMVRMDVSVHLVWDDFYDEYLGIAYVSSM